MTHEEQILHLIRIEGLKATVSARKTVQCRVIVVDKCEFQQKKYKKKRKNKQT